MYWKSGGIAQSLLTSAVSINVWLALSPSRFTPGGAIHEYLSYSIFAIPEHLTGFASLIKKLSGKSNL
jgi:hypothetical protein